MMTHASRSGFSKLVIPGLFVVSMAAVVVLQKGALFILLAMLPAIMAYFIDNHPKKAMFKTILACNFASTLPSLVPMIKAGLAMKQLDVSAIMGNPSTWLFVYSGAAAGWCLVFLCRMVARFIMILSYEYNIIHLEWVQRRLTEEWGDLKSREEM
jgi:hypothetical protein